MQQLQLSCEEATDSIICDQDNGLVWTESASFGARFQLEAPETLDTLIVINGAGRQGHKISGINIQIKKRALEIWQNLAKVKVKGDDGANVTDNGPVFLSLSQKHLQITFKPIREVTEVWIRLLQAQNEVVTINEVLIPRESNFFV